MNFLTLERLPNPVAKAIKESPIMQFGRKARDRHLLSEDSDVDAVDRMQMMRYNLLRTGG